MKILQPNKKISVKCIIPIFYALCIFITTQGFSKEKDLKSFVDQVVKNYMDRTRTHGLIVGVLDGNSDDPKTFAYGEVSRENREQINENTEFRIGSITKVFTATMLAKAISDGKLSLSDKAQKYLPHVRLPTYHGQEITIVNLATHTSGLPDTPPNMRNRETYSKKDLFEYLDHATLYHAPGHHWLYSDLGYAILSLIIENIDKGRWYDLVKEQVTSPLDMRSTLPGPLFTRDLKRNTTPGFTKDDPQHSYDVERLASPFLGAGGLYSNMHDMMIFMKANMGINSSFIKNLMPMLQKPRFTIPGGDPGEMGLAWQMYKLSADSSLEMVTKGGALGGYRAFIAFIPEKKQGVIVLTNNNTGTVQDINKAILGFLNDVPAYSER